MDGRCPVECACYTNALIAAARPLSDGDANKPSPHPRLRLPPVPPPVRPTPPSLLFYVYTAIALEGGEKHEEGDIRWVSSNTAHTRRFEVTSQITAVRIFRQTAAMTNFSHSHSSKTTTARARVRSIVECLRMNVGLSFESVRGDLQCGSRGFGGDDDDLGTVCPPFPTPTPLIFLPRRRTGRRRRLQLRIDKEKTISNGIAAAAAVRKPRPLRRRLPRPACWQDIYKSRGRERGGEGEFGIDLAIHGRRAATVWPIEAGAAAAGAAVGLLPPLPY